ncbi:LysR family transcriptional regulator [Halobacteriovorax sp. GB3]|uniref:LysR family transcriptional regulator n=1 Tax=Halobacteriovorax sp. GB3 TaxID=2719615 RepID=UPI002360CA39|nr:LysR family transcriptional regulator [Halobacteriovorax sp. GB3]MDD0853474.1 LysR family transcriptional regulator [Halobacteriovorax sp. GB3]
MLIDQVSLQTLRIFETVYREKTMSKAAIYLNMTQPGVSQHIQSLEESLGKKLFDRLGRKLVPTPNAKELYSSIRETLFTLEETLQQAKGDRDELKGKITFGLPIEFGNNIILPLMAKWSKNNPRVQFEIHYGHAKQMNDLLEDGRLDFAIVDSYSFSGRIKTVNLSKEHLVLCSSHEYISEKKLPQKMKFKNYHDLDFLDYVEGAPLLKQWFTHHYKGRIPNLNMKAQLMDVQGISQMISKGLGLGILPMHIVNRLEKQGKKFAIFEGSTSPLYNEINLATLSMKSQSYTTSDFINYLLESMIEREIRMNE